MRPRSPSSACRPAAMATTALAISPMTRMHSRASTPRRTWACNPTSRSPSKIPRLVPSWATAWRLWIRRHSTPAMTPRFARRSPLLSRAPTGARGQNASVKFTVSTTTPTTRRPSLAGASPRTSTSISCQPRVAAATAASWFGCSWRSWRVRAPPACIWGLQPPTRLRWRSTQSWGSRSCRATRRRWLWGASWRRRPSQGHPPSPATATWPRTSLGRAWRSRAAARRLGPRGSPSRSPTRGPSQR